MIAIDELLETAKRCQLIVDNCDDKKEKFVAFQAIQNLQQVILGLKGLEKHPDLENAAEEFCESLNSKK